jgi:hypothetical protein
LDVCFDDHDGDGVEVEDCDGGLFVGFGKSFLSR